jgi:prephenate dehydrogenase
MSEQARGRRAAGESAFAAKTVAIVGVGLMGGSLGLAARAKAGVRRVVGYSRTPETLRRALELGAVSEAAASLEEAVAAADLAFVCTPVRDVVEHVRRAYAAARLGCVVTDVGSTKNGLMASLSWEQQATCIGGHPLCGAETAGVENARASLYEGATYFLTPGAHVRHDSFQLLFDFVSALGARPVAIDPVEHDRLMALVSHLPHVLANTLMTQAGARGRGRDALLSTGPSFRDLTRIAGSNRRVWTDIFIENRVALLEAVRAFQAGLGEVEEALEQADAERLAEQISAAATNRERMLVEANLSPEALYRLEVQVPDRPGEFKKIMTALGDENINVEDLAMHHLSAELGGTLTVYVMGDDVRRRAADVVAQLGYPLSTAKAVE